MVAGDQSESQGGSGRREAGISSARQRASAGWEAWDVRFFLSFLLSLNCGAQPSLGSTFGSPETPCRSYSFFPFGKKKALPKYIYKLNGYKNC